MLGVGEGLGVGEELGFVEGAGEGVGEGVGVGNMSPVPSGLPLSRFVADITYATKDTSKQTHTNKAINAFLPILHLH